MASKMVLKVSRADVGFTRPGECDNCGGWLLQMWPEVPVPTRQVRRYVVPFQPDYFTLCGPCVVWFASGSDSVPDHIIEYVIEYKSSRA
jgi:hypothetical protein